MTIDDEVIQSLETSISVESMAVIGLGNLDRADDGVGLALVSRLQVYLPERIFLETEHNVEALVFRLLDREDIQTILFIDATHFGGEPGDIRLFHVEDIERFVPVLSTHKIPISLLMGLIRDRGKIPIL
ncbi:hydrogenase maturation protease, partial [bacterium]|nr:hydrogenase maturation protease [bacterium]